MARIKILVQKPTNLNFIINELLAPEIRHTLFDDVYGYQEITSILYAPSTVVFGIFNKGHPDPIGTIILTGALPFRNAYIYVAIFEKENRNKKVLHSIIEDLKKEITKNFRLSSITAHVIGENLTSEHLLDKMEFKKIGTKEKAIVTFGEYRDIHIYYKLLNVSPKRKEN